MRLLLAEDERALSEALVKIFEYNYYSVDAVFDGVTALEYLETGNYDGVVLDIMMPGKNGIEVLKTMRARGDGTPVILLTARSEIDDKVNGLDAGANDYLTKPFATKELLARIRAMTRKDTVTDTVKHMGNIALDTVLFEMKNAENSIKLTNKEFQLFELLLDNRDRYLTTEYMMERVWGYDSESEINVVWAHVSFLRRKLKTLGANIEITVSRGLGYRLEEKDDK